jgi:hypothetical protein
VKIGDLVRYAGTRDAEFLGIITKGSRIQPRSQQTIEYYVVWVNVDNHGWWTKDLLKKVTNENR